MIGFIAQWWPWSAFVCPLLGFASLLLTRLDENSESGHRGQRLFYLALLGVGVATIVCICQCAEAWMTCSATLSIMAVGGTLDFSRTSTSSTL